MEGSERIASCSCGQLRVTTTGEPVRVSVCHCLECQKRTGSAFGVQARFPRAQVRSIEGRASTWSRTGDEGHTATFSFCPDCSSIVHWSFAEQPDVLAVPVGAFADPKFPAPVFAVYDARRHSWCTVSGVEVMD